MRDFELPDQNGDLFSLGAELSRGAVVLVFYRADWCPYCNGQLVELARAYGDFREAGAELAAISTDPIGAGAGLTEKLDLPFPLLSDADGAGAIRQAGVWDEAEGVSRIAAVALAPDWLELFRFEGVDYADRPLTADILEAVRALGLIPREPCEGVHPHARPEPSGRAMAPWELALYLRGVRSSSRAIYERNGDEDAGRVWRMADRYHRFFEQPR